MDVRDHTANYGGLPILSLREVPLGGTTKQSSWIATARFAHLAMTAQSVGCSPLGERLSETRQLRLPEWV